jgi:hypothetical protein
LPTPSFTRRLPYFDQAVFYMAMAATAIGSSRIPATCLHEFWKEYASLHPKDVAL